MVLIGENIMDKSALFQAPQVANACRYPRFYGPSTNTKRFFVLLSAVLLAAPFLSDDRSLRVFFIGCAMLVCMACIAYAFGSKLELHADKIASQHFFFFTRTMQRDQFLSWQLHLTETRSPMFLLILKPVRKEQKDLTIEINFGMDSAFYAWFPGLQTLVQERVKQFPALASISGQS